MAYRTTEMTTVDDIDILVLMNEKTFAEIAEILTKFYKADPPVTEDMVGKRYVAMSKMDTGELLNRVGIKLSLKLGERFCTGPHDFLISKYTN
ncbi:MAG: hypothetical protein JRD89_12220 [Deltaproteobacteria bacterium]|nr:hypothetical protein [Deltaproteobacteria bacterium]